MKYVKPGMDLKLELINVKYNEHHQYKQTVFLNLRALDYTIKILMSYDNIVHCTCSAGKIPNE